MTYRLTPKALSGVDRILDWVEDRFGVEVSDNVDKRLERAFDLLASQPGVGHVRHDIVESDEVLFWPVGPSLIAYRLVGTDVEVIAVERGAADWERVVEDL